MMGLPSANLTARLLLDALKFRRGLKSEGGRASAEQQGLSSSSWPLDDGQRH